MPYAQGGCASGSATGSEADLAGCVVAGLELAHNALSGTLPPSLGNLTWLQTIELGGNRLTGVLPGSIGGLAQLRLLDASNNSLVGALPTSLLQLRSLRSLALGGNAFAFDDEALHGLWYACSNDAALSCEGVPPHGCDPGFSWAL